MSTFRHIIETGSGPRVWVLFHGTGGTETDLIPIARRLDATGTVFGIRGNVLENGMPRFFRRLAEGVFDEADIRRQAADLAAFLKETYIANGFNAADCVALGYSNGANIISAINVLHPGLFGASVLLRPMVPVKPDAQSGLEGSRVLLLDGAWDPLSPPGEPERLMDAYRGMGATPERTIIQAGHNLTAQDLDAIAAWL
jgi:phospholipase/carboxylesterase